MRAPAFTLPATRGDSVRLTEYRGRWVVLYFYPKDMTAGCISEACDFRDHYPQFVKLGVEVLGVSSDGLEQHAAFVKRHRLPFPLLVDRDAKLARKYGAWREKRNYGRSYPGLVRSTFVIDPSGKIARIYDNVRVKDHVKKVLGALREECACD